MYTPLLYGTLLAFIDVIVLSVLQMRHMGWLKSNLVFLFSFIVYGCQSLIFYNSLSVTSLTVMNLMWDLISDVIVTVFGLLIFKDQLTHRQMFGLVLGFAALMCLK